MNETTTPTKCTDGPWAMHSPEYCPHEIWGDLDGPDEGRIHGTLVCTVNEELAADVLYANAKLIAAAPELLAACESLVAHDKNGRFGKPDFPAAIRQAEAAIRKARGH